MDATTLPPWLQALLRRESGGNWGIVNDGGYSGGFQFGEGAARDSGTYSGDGNLTDNRFGGTFRGPNGETLTYDQWLASPDAQLATMGGWTQSLDRQIRARGLDQYVGQTVNGVPVTMEGLYTGAHLGGVGGLSSWLRGAGNPADGNGTRVGDYVAMGSGSGGGGMQQPTMGAPALAGLAPAAGGQDMATGGLLGVAPAAPALQQSWLGGLLDIQPSEEQGLLGQIVNPQNSSDRQAIMQMAAAMLQASGPSTEPRSFGSSLGAGLQGYAAGQQLGAKQDENKLRAQARAQMEAMIASLPPEQQALARANPAAFSELMMQRQFGAQGPNTTGLPTGYMWDPTGTQAVPIPGVPQTGPDLTALQQNLIAAGLTPGSPEFRQAVLAGTAGGTTINLDTAGAGGDPANISMREMQKGLGGALATQYQTMMDTGRAANLMLGDINQLEALLSQTPQGTLAPLGAQIGGLAKSVGIDIAGFDPSSAQAVNSIVARIVPALRPPGSGTTSDRDLALFQQSLPALSNTPQGNQAIVAVLRAMAERRVQEGQIATAVATGQLTPAKAQATLANLGPYITPDLAATIAALSGQRSQGGPIDLTTTPAYQPGLQPAPAGAAPAAPMSPSGAPPIGTIDGGFRYMGGDPADPASWEPVQ